MNPPLEVSAIEDERARIANLLRCALCAGSGQCPGEYGPTECWNCAGFGINPDVRLSDIIDPESPASDDLRDDRDRLKQISQAIITHGSTVWSNGSCGTGQPAGQAIMCTRHGEVVDHLAVGALQGHTLEQLADQWERFVPGSARLDQPPRPARRAGPDGRPV